MQLLREDELGSKVNGQGGGEVSYERLYETVLYGPPEHRAKCRFAETCTSLVVLGRDMSENKTETEAEKEVNKEEDWYIPIRYGDVKYKSSVTLNEATTFETHDALNEGRMLSRCHITGEMECDLGTKDSKCRDESIKKSCGHDQDT